MNDHELRQALQQLDRQKASQDFAARLSARTAKAPPGSEARRISRAAGALAAALLISFVLLTGLAVRLRSLDAPEGEESPQQAVTLQPSKPPESRAAAAGAVPERRGPLRVEDLAHLRREHRRLRREVEELRRLMQAGEPALYLGGNDRFDLFLPLEEAPLQRAPGTADQSPAPALRVLPASWKSL